MVSEFWHRRLPGMVSHQFRRCKIVRWLACSEADPSPHADGMKGSIAYEAAGPEPGGGNDCDVHDRRGVTKRKAGCMVEHAGARLLARGTVMEAETSSVSDPRVATPAVGQIFIATRHLTGSRQGERDDFSVVAGRMRRSCLRAVF